MSSWQRPTDADSLQSHDPWRSHHWQVTLHLPTLWVRTHMETAYLRYLPQEHAASPLCKLLSYSKRSFSSWTSTSHVDVGTEQKMFPQASALVAPRL